MSESQITVTPYESVRANIIEYDADTQEVIRTTESLHFGTTPPGQYSVPVVIKLNVVNVQAIDNIRLAIVKTGAQGTGASGTNNDDNSVTQGNYGIEHSENLVVKSSLNSFFPGVNGTEDPASAFNVDIGRLSKTESEYIYLNVKMPSSTQVSYVTYRWFFDFY